MDFTQTLIIGSNPIWSAWTWQGEIYLMRLYNNSVFPFAKRILFDIRIELVTPAKPTAFAAAPFHSHSND